MAKVLRLKNKNRYEQLTFRRGLDVYHPVHDGNGDLILPLEILSDSKFSDLVPDIISETEEIDHVPLNQQTFLDLDAQGKIEKRIRIPDTDTPKKTKNEKSN